MSNKIVTLDKLTLYNDKINQRKQDVLISGQNIKTINGQSIVGAGNIQIEGGQSGSTTSLTIPIVSQTTTTITSLQPNVYNKWDIITSLTIASFATSGENTLNKYMLEFTPGSTGCTLTMPREIYWENNSQLVPEPFKTCQITIINNIAVCTQTYLTRDFYVQDIGTSTVYGPYKFVPGMTGDDYLENAEYLDSCTPRLVFATGSVALPINGWNYTIISNSQLIEETTYQIDSSQGSTGGEPA